MEWKVFLCSYGICNFIKWNCPFLEQFPLSHLIFHSDRRFFINILNRIGNWLKNWLCCKPDWIKPQIRWKDWEACIHVQVLTRVLPIACSAFLIRKIFQNVQFLYSFPLPSEETCSVSLRQNVCPCNSYNSQISVKFWYGNFWKYLIFRILYYF